MARRLSTGLLAAVLPLVMAGSLEAQYNPLSPPQPKGLGVSPSYNGWYPNPDGTITLSFGYVNRNTEEVLSIPAGPNNFVAPGEADQGQPTYFLPRRHFGVFTVTVPGDFGPTDSVVWTLEANGERYAIAGKLAPAYQIDALHTTTMDRARYEESRPPVVVLEPEGEESRGPNGFALGPLRARVGEPLPLTVWAWDEDGERRPTERNVTLRWYEYRSPGPVDFDGRTVAVRAGAFEGTATVTFATPGEYVLLVQAHHSDIPVTSAGHAQCCWTNGYVKVTVTE